MSDMDAVPVPHIRKRQPQDKLRPNPKQTRAAIRAAGGDHPGRPKRPLTSRDREAILADVRAGLDVVSAAASAGVNQSVLGRWLVDYPDFAVDFKKAQRHHIESCLARLRELPAGRWQAAAWELERLYPERFGQGLKPAIEAHFKVEVSAQVCTAMSESWRTFEAQVVAKQRDDQLGANNINYVGKADRTDATKALPEVCEAKEADDGPPTGAASCADQASDADAGGPS